MKDWPKAGSKATFRGTSEWFLFKNILKDANDLLEIGKEYTITKIELASSWCAVILDEFPDKKFSLSWFTYDKDLTTEEVMKLERESWETVKYEFTTLEEFSKKAKNNEKILKEMSEEVAKVVSEVDALERKERAEKILNKNETN